MPQLIFHVRISVILAFFYPLKRGLIGRKVLTYGRFHAHDYDIGIAHGWLLVVDVKLAAASRTGYYERFALARGRSFPYYLLRFFETVLVNPPVFVFPVPTCAQGF